MEISDSYFTAVELDNHAVHVPWAYVYFEIMTQRISKEPLIVTFDNFVLLMIAEL